MVVVDYQGKTRFLADTIAGLGYGLRERLDPANVQAVIVDWPAGWLHYYTGSDKARIVRAAAAQNVRVVSVPHGGNPLVAQSDVPFHSAVSVEVVHAPGHKRLLEQMGCPCPVVDVGWCFSETRDFRAEQADRVLFAPTHPSADGSYRCDGRRQSNSFVAQNKVAFAQFLAYPAREKTVRFGGTLEQNGLWRDPRVTRWVRSDLRVDSAVRDIDRHDLVIGDGTFLGLAVARGVPAVSVGEPVCMDEQGETFPAWDDGVRYPVALDRLTLTEAVDLSMSGAASGWAAEWVGGPLDPGKLKECIGESDGALA